MNTDKLQFSLIGKYLSESASMLSFSKIALEFYASPMFENYHRLLSTIDGKPVETPLKISFLFEQQLTRLNIEDAIAVLKKNNNGVAICFKSTPAIDGVYDFDNRIWISYPVFDPDTEKIYQYTYLGEPVVIATKEEYYESLKCNISDLYESFFRSQRIEIEETV